MLPPTPTPTLKSVIGNFGKILNFGKTDEIFSGENYEN